MARWHYDLCGAEPIIRDVPVYAVGSVANGTMIQGVATATAAHSGFMESNALTSTCGVDALGACLENINTSSVADYGDIVTTAASGNAAAISSIAATVALGSRYAKVIINPFAVYLFDWDDSALSAWVCAANAGTTTYTDTVEQYVEGSWFYVIPALSSTADGGQLRYITATSTTATWTLLTAMTTTTADYGLHIKPINHTLFSVNAAGTATVYAPTKLSNLTANDAGAIVTYRSIENYVMGSGMPMERLRASIHNGMKDKTLKFATDIVQLDHIYCHGAL